MNSEAEIGLNEADQSIAEAEHNIRQVGSLIPELAIHGYSTVEVEGQVEQMLQVLDYLRAQRRTIVEKLDAGMPPPPLPRRARPSLQEQKSGPLRAIFMRLGGS